MFPSNIAGLPTWYTIRANKHGYIARKKEVDFLVAMNPETAREDVLSLEPGTAVLYDEPLKLSGLRARPDLLPGAVRQDRRRGLQGRQAAPPRQEHDLRRRALEAAQHRPGADGARAEAPDGEEAEGHRAEHGRARSRLRLRRAAPAQARPVLGRADGQDDRDDPGRRQRRRRARLHDGRRHGRRLVSDHAIVFAAGNADRLPEEVPHGSRDRARRPTPSSRRKTRLRRSGW